MPGISIEAANIVFQLAPAACCCLAPSPEPAGLSGDRYRCERARAVARETMEEVRHAMSLVF